MNNRRRIIFLWCTTLLFSCSTDLATIRRNCSVVGRIPVIEPDFTGITIPPNIAPMRFAVREDSCAACIVEFASVNGAPVMVRGRNGRVGINAAPWKRLLSQNAGGPLRITVYARGGRGGAWRRYAAIENTVAAEPIDRYCTYRLLNFQYSYWRDLRMCQRDLTSFNETTFLNTLHYTKNNMGAVTGTDAQTGATPRSGRKDAAENGKFRCVNCHMPMNNDPGRFILQLRSTAYGSETLIADGDSITMLSSKLGYGAWHPGGKRIAFSVYKVQQYFHAVGRQFIDVYDNRSRIVVYDVNNRKIIPAAPLVRQGVLDSWPAWSPDGRYLYFCSAPVPWSDGSGEPPKNFNRTKYSLMRMAYDAENNTWGDVDTVLSAGETGLSISMPRFSPDHRFCIVCMQAYGPYPYTEASSDLYIMDIATRSCRKLPCNSEYNDSWHSWSANGRWILFSSRRGGGIFTRLYISHIDSAGNATKPFIMPQRDPAFYDSFLKCYNVAEFATAPVRFSERQLLRTIRNRRIVTVALPAEPAVQETGTSGGEPSDGHNH